MCWGRGCDETSGEDSEVVPLAFLGREAMRVLRVVGILLC